MRKMKRSDVHEWIPGEPLERVDFGNGCTGMDKSLPKEPVRWAISSVSSGNAVPSKRTEGHALMCFHPNIGLTT